MAVEMDGGAELAAVTLDSWRRRRLLTSTSAQVTGQSSRRADATLVQSSSGPTPPSCLASALGRATRSCLQTGLMARDIALVEVPAWCAIPCGVVVAPPLLTFVTSTGRCAGG
eukprot:COSAG01_NODE_1192_length_11309_cov_8.575609_4_plen_113_part_00